MIARIAWAFEKNRDLPSPSGVDYGARADYWKNHLLVNYEEKWRSGRPYTSREWPEPIRLREGHTWFELIAYQHYMHKLTGEAEWRTIRDTYYVDKLFDTPRDESAGVAGGFAEVSTPIGLAYVWPSRIPTGGHEDPRNVRMTSMPTGYARYVYTSMVDLSLEEVERFVEERAMEKMAAGLVHFQLDVNDDIYFYNDVTGYEEVAGILPAGADSNSMSASRWRISGTGLAAGWDATGTVRDVNERVWNGRSPHIAAGMLVDLVMDDE